MKRDSKNSPVDIAIAACAFEVQADGAIQLTPVGTFNAKDGRPHGLKGWRIDDSNVDKLLAILKAHKDDIVIDYEHQTLYADKNGQPAPASGWFKGSDVEHRPGQGLFVVPTWTAAAKAAIDADEYKYFSPVLKYNKRTGDVLDIQMGALVNFAAIDGMKEVEALAAAKFLTNQPPEDHPMEDLLKLFGLKSDASEEDAIAALKALQEENTTLKQKVTDKDTAIAAAKALTPDTAVAAMQGMQTELAALKAQVNGNEIDTLVDTAMADGRLTPATEPWARGHAKAHGVAALKSYLDQASPIAALKGKQTDGKNLDDEGNPELDDTALAVCKQMGIDPAEYKKTLAEDPAYA